MSGNFTRELLVACYKCYCWATWGFHTSFFVYRAEAMVLGWIVAMMISKFISSHSRSSIPIEGINSFAVAVNLIEWFDSHSILLIPFYALTVRVPTQSWNLEKVLKTKFIFQDLECYLHLILNWHVIVYTRLWCILRLPIHRITFFAWVLFLRRPQQRKNKSTKGFSIVWFQCKYKSC
jgi:hypothetical protein